MYGQQFQCKNCVGDPYYQNRGPQQQGCGPCGQQQIAGPCQKSCKKECDCKKCVNVPKSYYDPRLANGCNGPPLLRQGMPQRSVTCWKLNYLTANRQNLAAHLDPLLINPWGIVVFHNQLWVVNNTSDVITNYDLFGNRILGPISLRDAYQNATHPTGIAINCGGGFSVTNGAATRSAQFLIASEHGVVEAYNPMVDPTQAFITLNMQITGRISVFKGLAVANNILYLANFFQRVIDVFDSSYNRLLGFNFVDGDTSDPIPMDYSPHNIVHIGCYLYVLWARKDPNITLAPLFGPGHGYVSVFNYDGSFVRRFTSRGVLDTPWAMVPAPCNCGFPPGSFLIGNNGNGRINVFDCNGAFIGPMLGQSGLPIVIEGLRGLAPHYAEFNEIFYTASPENLVDGYIGSIVADQVITF